MTAGHDASKRFLNAFSAIEVHLRNRRPDASLRRASFYELVDDAAKRETAVRRFQIDLKEYADLRNAIVHERIGGDPIAEPHLQTVTALETILSRITAPPKLRTTFPTPVVTCTANESVSSAARKMRNGDFSQLPVVDGRIAAVLTAETIARWLAASMAEDEIVLGAPVAEVLRHTEDPDHWRLVSANASIYDAKYLFDDFARRGKSLDALVITHSGQPTDKPIGIVTVFDYPRLEA